MSKNENLSHPQIKGFFHASTGTCSYVACDLVSRECAIIDPVLDFDCTTGRTGTQSADRMLDYVESIGGKLEWILETHIHADHLSSADYLRKQTGADIAISENISEVQQTFKKHFNLEEEFATDGRQFDRLLSDGDQLTLGQLRIDVLHTPGHTPACISYRVGDAIFVGDTIFMPDVGTARTDFPGGDAHILCQSIKRILDLPEQTRIFVCHDYFGDERPPAFETTVGDQRKSNIHIRDGRSEEDFIALRQARDQQLTLPELIIPSLQVNIRAGRLPLVEDNGVAYLKIPLNLL